MSSAEKDLRTALVDMRRDLANMQLGKRSFLAPQALMPTSLIDRIVGLAHERKLPTLEALRAERVAEGLKMGKQVYGEW